MVTIADTPLLVSTPANIRYITGFVSVAPHAREAYAVVTHDEIALFTNPLYTEQARQLLHDRPVELVWHGIPLVVIEYSAETPFPEALSAYCDEKHLNTLSFEEKNLTVAELSSLENAMSDISFAASSGTIESHRRIKRDDEIEHIKKAARLTDECYAYIVRQVREGVTEQELAWGIESFIRTRGGTIAFSPIVAFGAHASLPHYQGTRDTKLSPQTPILFDFGAQANGYCADMTRMAYFGTPDDAFLTVFEAVSAAQQKALDYLDQPGERHGAKADTIARDEIRDRSLPDYPHSLGHALGLDIHESPRLSAHRDELLEPDAVVTVEPGVYIEGEVGVRIEDLVIITDQGIEILSQTSKQLTIIQPKEAS